MGEGAVDGLNVDASGLTRTAASGCGDNQKDRFRRNSKWKLKPKRRQQGIRKKGGLRDQRARASEERKTDSGKSASTHKRVKEKDATGKGLSREDGNKCGVDHQSLMKRRAGSEKLWLTSWAISTSKLSDEGLKDQRGMELGDGGGYWKKERKGKETTKQLNLQEAPSTTYCKPTSTKD